MYRRSYLLWSPVTGGVLVPSAAQTSTRVVVVVVAPAAFVVSAAATVVQLFVLVLVGLGKQHAPRECCVCRKDVMVGCVRLLWEL